MPILVLKEILSTLVLGFFCTVSRTLSSLQPKLPMFYIHLWEKKNLPKNSVRGKDDVPVRAMKAHSGEQIYSSTLSLPQQQMEFSGQIYTLVSLTLGKNLGIH